MIEATPTCRRSWVQILWGVRVGLGGGGGEKKKKEKKLPQTDLKNSLQSLTMFSNFLM